MPRFYVTLTWDDWPEGGSYGEIVDAKNHDEAEQIVRRMMASSRCEGDDPEDWDVETDEQMIDAVLKALSDEWHLVDCWEIDDFVRRNATGDNLPGPGTFFTVADKPEACTLSDEDFNDWLDNAGGQLQGSLAHHGNDWIETMLEQDGLMKEEDAA